MRFKLALIVLGGYCAFRGWNEFVVSQGTAMEPVAMSLAQIEAGEEPPNKHVTLGEHWAVFAASVYTYKAARGEEESASSKVTETFYPVLSHTHPFMVELNALEAKYGTLDDVPDDVAWPVLSNPSMLIKTDVFKTIGTIPDGLVDTESVTGLIINEIDGLDKEEKSLLSESFDANLDDIWILEEAREPASAGKSYGLMGGGGFLALFGLYLFKPKKRRTYAQSDDEDAESEE